MPTVAMFSGRNDTATRSAIPAGRPDLMEFLEAAVAAEAMVAQAEVAILVPAVEAKLAMLEIAAPMAAVVAMFGLLNRVRMDVACR